MIITVSSVASFEVIYDDEADYYKDNIKREINSAVREVLARYFSKAIIDIPSSKVELIKAEDIYQYDYSTLD